MLAIDLIKIGCELLKKISECDVKASDYRYIKMYEEYVEMVRAGHKKEYVYCVLSERYHISESTVFRLIRRFKREVNI